MFPSSAQKRGTHVCSEYKHMLVRLHSPDQKTLGKVLFVLYLYCLGNKLSGLCSHKEHRHGTWPPAGHVLLSKVQVDKARSVLSSRPARARARAMSLAIPYAASLKLGRCACTFSLLTLERVGTGPSGVLLGQSLYL